MQFTHRRRRIAAASACVGVLIATLSLSSCPADAQNTTTPAPTTAPETTSNASAANITTASVNATTNSTTAPANTTAMPETTPGLTVGSPDSSNRTLPCGLPNHRCNLTAAPPELLPAPRVLPDGVTELAPRPEEEGTDLSECICDLTRAICDANCNCDADCSDDEKGRFTTEYGVEVKAEGYEEDIGVCVSKDQFLRINAPVVREDSPLCVLVNNNPSLGNFFAPPGPSVSDDEVRLEFAEHGVGPWVPYAPPEQPESTAYQVGMLIPTAIASTELGSTDAACDAANCVPGVYGPLRHLSLPYPGPAGRCVPGNFVRFWEGTEETGPCVEGGAAADVCTATSGLSATSHVQNLLVATRPSQLAQLSEWALANKWLAVRAEVLVEEQDSLYVAEGVPTPELHAADGRCVNVMKELHLAIVRDGSGGIASATAVVRLGHLRPRADGQLWVQQHFSVDFLDSDTAARTQPALLAPLERSGNPGYVQGKPVLAGYARNVNNASLPALSAAIEKLVGGLQLPRMARADGQCSVCAVTAEAGEWACEDGVGEAEGVRVLFNQDLELGCQLRLSRRELRSFCEAGTLHPLLTYDPRLRVGIWGDSEPSNHFEWLPSVDANPARLAQNLEPEASQNWNERGVCERAPTSMHLQILTADVGNVKNPQRKILGARIDYGLSDLAALHADPDTRAAYFISASVSFLRIGDGGSVEVVPPAPSLLPVLPDDIFYPFSSSGPAPSSSRPSLPLSLALAASLVAILRR